MKTLQALLLVVIAIILLTALKPYLYRNDPNIPLGSYDSICYSMDSIELAKWASEGGQNPIVFPIKKTAGPKEDFELACRMLNKNFLVGGKQVTEKEFRKLLGNYVLYLKKAGVMKSQVAPGYILDVSKKSQVTVCINPKTQKMVFPKYSLERFDTICCRCPPACVTHQLQKVVDDVIQKQYQ